MTTGEREGPRIVFEVRYDDDDTYFVAARYTARERADHLRDRLLAAHTTADKDGCHLDSAWTVVAIEVDDTEPDVPLPPDLFDNSAAYDDHHATVNIDRLPLPAALSQPEGAGEP